MVMFHSYVSLPEGKYPMMQPDQGCQVDYVKTCQVCLNHFKSHTKIIELLSQTKILKKNWGPAAPKRRRLGRIAHQLSLLFSEGLQATGTIWNTGRIRAAGWVEDNLISHLGLFYGYSTSKRWYLVNLCWKSAKHSQTINHPGNKRGFLLSFGIYS